ncbi:GAF domain-containing protein [Xenococcus sp. PCC 7305]|uniref:GAF domain-containing protein n=1 Tax=Xenococcus sp. PCC 7305 TaxID=102125 RepID=UPI0002AC5106|nr:GAF domain-containing protein [Xenococcus sp. PCC 7305]ELS01842.1 GAF domain-containing protein [Xenococcus sp. PCC 7305]
MSDTGLKQVLSRLSQNLVRDNIVQEVSRSLRNYLGVDRVVLYYFYQQWEGQVTFEALSAPEYSLFGSKGPDDCFNGEYAALYQAGRVSAIEDIETAEIAECHRDFLRKLRVRANLVVPVLPPRGLWGLLVAHHCEQARSWSQEDIEQMQQGARKLAEAESIMTVS